MAALVGCGDDALFDQDVSTISQQIYVVPERFTGEPYTFGYQPHPIYLEVDQVVKFWATYIVDDHYLPTDNYDEYIAGKSWDVDGEYFNINSFRYSFSEPGHKIVTLKSVDLANDTIVEKLDVYVNTPISVDINYPADGFNMVDPLSEDGVELSWNVSGKDDWESSSCTIYISYDKNTVWKNPQARGSCNEPGTLLGPLGKNVSGDSAVTFYWGVIATNYGGQNFTETDTTPIYSFSTKFKDADSASLVLPIVYFDFWGMDSIETLITIVGNAGDTLATFTKTNYNAPVTMKVVPQSGLRIFATEKKRSEYKAQSLSVDILAPAKYTLDTMTFVDRTPPLVEPTAATFDSSGYISFIAVDNGSGINMTRINVISGGDTLSSIYEDNIIKFKRPLFFDHTFIKVSVQDHSKNSSADAYWELKLSGTKILVSGPYSDDGGL